MRIDVKLFGVLREEAGARSVTLDLPEGASLRDLRDQMAADHPAIDRFGERLAISRNLEVSPLDTQLADGDEVALLPPVSGGADERASDSTSESARRCTISSEPLVEEEVARRVAGPDAGGIVTFAGAVRDHARGSQIKYLEYEAYPAMAEREMEKIADEAAERWPGTRVAIAHRVGHLEIGELAVVVVAASPHRGEAFDACRFAIDTLKVTVPIWKKEMAVDGQYWVDDHA